MRRDKLDSLTIAATIGLTPEDQRAFSYLKPEKRIDFVQNCEVALLQIGVNYEFQPDRDNAQSVSLAKVLFYDGLTKQSFLDGIMEPCRALELVNLQYSRLRSSILQP